MSMELETMTVGNSAPGFDRLACIRPTILQEELKIWIQL